MHLRASRPLAAAALLSALAPFAAAQTYTAWRDAHFTTAELADPALSGPAADPDADGIPNLHEYVFVGAPLLSEAHLTPTLAVVADTLALTYRERHGLAASGVRVNLEVSDTLFHWITPNTVLEADREPFATEGYDLVTLLDPLPLPSAPSPPRRFLRLRADASAPTTALKAPTSPALSALSPATYELRWSDWNRDETGHRVERLSSASGLWESVGTAAADTASWLHTAADYRDGFTYRVSALRSTDGSSATSVPVSLPDGDGDGIPDALELGASHSGDTGTYATFAHLADSDGDGLLDGAESGFGLDPLVADAHTLVTSLPGLRLFLSADHGLALDENGAVASWLDRSPAGHLATQELPSARPRPSNPAGSRLPLLSFDGIDDHLRLPDLMAGAHAGEIVVVARLAAIDRSYNALLQFGQGFGTDYSADNGGTLWEDFGLADFEGYPAPPGFFALVTRLHVYHARISSGGRSEMGFNNIFHLRRGGGQPVVFHPEPRLGMSHAHVFFTGEIAEVVVFDRVLAPPERARLHRYLNARYGGALPGGVASETYRLPDLSDQDHDGVSDHEERLRGTAVDAYSAPGGELRYVVVGGTGQEPVPGAFFPEPMVLQAVAPDGTPCPFAPVEIDVASGGGLLAPTRDHPQPSAKLTLHADTDGYVRFYWKMP